MKPSTSKEDGLKYTTEEALHALQLLGAPEISLEDFERLHRGAMGKLLDSVISHMQGRQRVSSARVKIQKRYLLGLDWGLIGDLSLTFVGEIR